MGKRTGRQFKFNIAILSFSTDTTVTCDTCQIFRRVPYSDAQHVNLRYAINGANYTRKHLKLAKHNATMNIIEQLALPNGSR